LSNKVKIRFFSRQKFANGEFRLPQAIKIKEKAAKSFFEAIAFFNVFKKHKNFSTNIQSLSFVRYNSTSKKDLA
jgi:hypothetical protein